MQRRSKETMIPNVQSALVHQSSNATNVPTLLSAAVCLTVSGSRCKAHYYNIYPLEKHWW